MTSIKKQADFRRFLRLTKDKTLIVGRKTYIEMLQIIRKRNDFKEVSGLSYGRKCIVLSKSPTYSVAPPDQIATSIEMALDKTRAECEVLVIGGVEIFQAFLPFCNKIYLTVIHATIEGELKFDIPVKNSDWIEVYKKDFPADTMNQFAYTFYTFERHAH